MGRDHFLGRWRRRCGTLPMVQGAALRSINSEQVEAAPPPSSRHLGQHPEAGASAVEFAIAAPALILALLGTFQAALLYQARLQLEKEFIDFLNKNPKEAEKYGKTPIISYSEVHGANPEAIANRAYGNRYGNGGVESGDGWRYRGRGMIQLTFKDNYKNITNSFQQLYKKDISFFDNPDLVATPEYAMQTALVFWQQRNVGGTIDALAGRATDVSTTNKAVTKIVNGGTNGLTDRLSRLEKLLALPFFKKCEEAANKTIAFINYLLRVIA